MRQRQVSPHSAGSGSSDRNLSGISGKIDEALTLYSSPALNDDLAHTLHYQKSVQRIGRFGTTPSVAEYSALVTLVSPTQVPRVIERDADDDQVIAAAVAAQADLIVSGDRKHLLSLGSHEGIAIIMPAEALRRIDSE
jgi:putative PIN family toxin of toxin-antitoxin system